MNMKKWTTSLLALSLISGLSAAPAFADGHGRDHDRGNHYGWYKYQVNFQDIDSGFSWAQQAIQQLAGEGVFRGVDAYHFQPAGTLNRAQFAVLVSRYFGLQNTNGTQQDFRDVQYGDWYFNDIEAAKDYMTMFVDTQGGYDFKPDQPINRAEAAVTLVQALLKRNAVQLVTPDQANQILSVYSDANLIPQNLRVHVATAVQAGVIRGVGLNQFDPLSTLNRAQAATLLYRLQSQLQVLPIDPTTGQPIELPPGSTGTIYTPGTYTTGSVITYQSSSYSLPVGSQINVSSSQVGSVYLVPTNYTASNVSTLDSYVNSNTATKAYVNQANTTVVLSTNNLAAGTYTIYAADQYGNLSSLGSTITLTNNGSTYSYGPTVTYQSSSYSFSVGSQINVSSNQLGAVYLVPTNYSASNVSTLDSYVNSNTASKAYVNQVNTTVALNTNNLPAGSYTIYAANQYGNIASLGTTITLTGYTNNSGPTVTYQSPSYNLNVGNPVTVSSNELGAVYLIPTNYSVSNMSYLDSLVNSNVGSKAIVGQANSSVNLSTSNLPAGSYAIYAVDQYGNISRYANTVTLSGNSGYGSTISNVQLIGKSVDTSGSTIAAINVQTTNQANGTPVTVELVNTNGVSLNPVISTQSTISNNSAISTLTIPSYVSSGTYLVKVTVNGYTNESLSFTK